MLNKLKPKSEFSRNVLTLMTGTTIAQAIPIAISPILTRIYTPEDFGLFALYISIALLFATAATGRYELAIMLPKKESDAVNIVFLSLLITLIITLLTLFIVFFFNQSITNILGNQDISSWLYFIPFTVFFMGLYQSLNYWNNRKKEYKRLAISRVVQSGVTGGANLGMGGLQFGASGLIVGNIIGQSLSTLYLFNHVYKEDSRSIRFFNKIKIIALLKKYKKLPLLNMPNVLIDNFRLSGINILIAKFFTTSTLGQFALAWKMVQTPMSVIGKSLSQVFFQKIASVKRDELYAIIKKFIVKASLVALPIFLIIYFFSVDIFSFVFGENWSEAGEAASVMSPWLFLNFLTSPLSQIFIILNKQEIMLIFSIFYMATPLAILYLFQDLEFINALNMVTLSMSIMLLIFIGMVLFYAKREENLKYE